MLRFARHRKKPEPTPATALAEEYWQAHDVKLMDTGFAEMLCRLPTLIWQALRLAWTASRIDTAATIGLNLAAGVFTTVGLLATTGVLEALFAGGPTPERLRAALPAMLLVASAGAARAGLQAAAGWAQGRLGPQVDNIVERRLLELTTRVPLEAFDDSAFHDSMLRARDRGVITAHQVVQATVDIVSGLVGLLAVAGTLGILHPLLLPLLFVTALPDGWAAVRSARMGHRTMHSLSASTRRKWILSDLMAERPPAAELRSYGMRDFLLAEYGRIVGVQQRVALNLARRKAITRVAGDVLSGVTTGVMYLALGLLLATGGVPLAVAGTAVLAIRTGQGALANLVFATNRCYEQGLYFGDYLDFCEQARDRIPPPSAQAAPRRFDRITADHVTFTYPGADSPALVNVNIEIRRGEVVALVGENGSGKTTLAKILAGLYEPDSGLVRWDDMPLPEADRDLLRQHIAVIAQDHTNWPMSARHNITMGRAVDEAALRDAATAAGAGQVVDELPQGYDTLLDRRFKGGHELSGGQWQRIAVARGFYRDAPLLICDEPTAALDARAEHALFSRIRDHAAGRTVLLITHRLATVRYADRSYVLDHGRVIEHGTHDELMAVNGTYADLYTLQAAAYGLDPAAD